jgi:hypothetical protein
VQASSPVVRAEVHVSARPQKLADGGDAPSGGRKHEGGVAELVAKVDDVTTPWFRQRKLQRRFVPVEGSLPQRLPGGSLLPAFHAHTHQRIHFFSHAPRCTWPLLVLLTTRRVESWQQQRVSLK